MRYATLLAMCVCAMALRAPATAADTQPAGLLCNLLAHPEKTLITDPHPDFSWIFTTAEKNQTQTAYQIIVASSLDNARNGAGDVWDSPKVSSNQSINVDYAGPELRPHASYWWTVRTWDKGGRASAYATPQRFNTGDFDAKRTWPGQSRWVEIADDNGGKSWGFEDRHPIAYHEIPPANTIARDDGTYFIDFGRAAFATMRFTATWNPPDPAQKELAVEICVGEKRKGDAIDPKPGGGIIFRKYPMTIAPGTHEYTLQIPRFVPKYPHSQRMPEHMPEVVPFRYAQIAPAGGRIAISNLRQLALWYEFDDDAASFSSSSKPLNDIYHLCKYSVKANTFNGDYAASERERMLYEADTYIHQICHYAVDREFAIGRYSAGNMIFHGTWPTEWISHTVLMTWADYMQTGNAKFMRRYYAELKPKTMIALAREDGLISSRTHLQTKAFLASIHGTTLRDIVDWPTGESDGYVFRDYNAVVNAFHYRSLVLMGRIASALGNRPDADFYTARAAKVYDAFNTAFWDKSRGIYIDGIGTDHASMHANMFALAFGLVPQDRRAAVAAFVKSRKMACSVYPAGYLLEAMYDASEEQYALDLLTNDTDRGWLNMIRVGSTITTEAWDVKYKGNSGWSHAWSAWPAYIIPRKLMGIEPLEPGFGKILICPRMGNLTWAKMKLPTIRGAIEVEARNEPEQPYIVKVNIPGNVTARVMLPASTNTAATVQVDGQTVAGRIDGKHIVIEPIGSGEHVITRAR